MVVEIIGLFLISKKRFIVTLLTTSMEVYSTICGPLGFMEFPCYKVDVLKTNTFYLSLIMWAMEDLWMVISKTNVDIQMISNIRSLMKEYSHGNFDVSLSSVVAALEFLHKDWVQYILQAINDNINVHLDDLGPNCHTLRPWHVRAKRITLAAGILSYTNVIPVHRHLNYHVLESK